MRLKIMDYVELDIEIGELFNIIRNDEILPFDTEIIPSFSIQVLNETNEWVDVNYLITKNNIPMMKIVLENNIEITVAEEHIFHYNDNDVYAKDAVMVDVNGVNVPIIKKVKISPEDVFDISIPYPHLYRDSIGILHHNTMGVEQACAAVNRELVCFNLTNETTEEDLIGSFILDNGNMIWKDGPVLVAMRRGAVLLLDEIDQATTNVMCLQNVLQNKPYYVKKTNEMIKPEPGFTIVATANTKGDGDGSDRFVGANVMNEAFLERFNVVIEQDYPPPITEVKILKQHCTDDKFILSLVRWAKLARDNYKIGSIERCITTRRLVQIARNYSVFNNKNKAITYALNRFDDAVKEALFEYYTSITALTKYDDNLDFDIQYI